MTEPKPASGPEPLAGQARGADASRINSMDALNRRDIELIKRSLATMHKECAELRSTIVSLHGRQSKAPTRGFVLGLGVVALIVVGGLSVARPELNRVLGTNPAMAKLTGSEFNR